MKGKKDDDAEDDDYYDEYDDEKRPDRKQAKQKTKVLADRERMQLSRLAMRPGVELHQNYKTAIHMAGSIPTLFISVSS